MTNRQGRKYFRAVSSGLISLGLIAVLAGCQQHPTQPQEELNIPEQDSQADVVVAPAYVAKPGLTPKQRFRYALKKLNADKTDEALVELETYHESNPDDSRASRIIKQINSPIEELYPVESFPVELQWGQTLSTLSRDYLGDVYGFYGLAKYNGIPVSSKLVVGQSINIPATDRALRAKKEIEERAEKEASVEVNTEPMPEEIVEMEEDLADVEAPAAGASEETADEVQSAEVAAEESVNPAEAVVVSEATAAEAQREENVVKEGTPVEIVHSALAEEDYIKAAEVLQKMSDENSVPDSLTNEIPDIYLRASNQLEKENPVLASKYQFEIGRFLAQRGDLDAALPAYLRSAELDDTNTDAQKAAKELKAKLAAKYHRMATNAYRKQELDEAISLWEYVLDIDPDHSAAKAYLVQANELKGKLSKIKDQ
ncbi:lipopolysaccharide assembly protein LapB [Hahella sp. CCB-MM4]|uniref:tetratricopeptide repeat protein n=1 Tax=Hahella sp. (strain CCB-MM4) TaxID=1926491 RepID=UPI00113FFD9D|nr:hypothetical protein [Hahella sp. CCB-MM4]